MCRRLRHPWPSAFPSPSPPGPSSPAAPAVPASLPAPAEGRLPLLPLLLLPLPAAAPAKMSERGGFYRQELNKTVWEVPQRYQNLTPVGSGAYGSVW